MAHIHHSFLIVGKRTVLDREDRRDHLNWEEMKRTGTKEQRAHCQRFLENMDRLRQRMKLNSIEIVYFAV